MNSRDHSVLGLWSDHDAAYSLMTAGSHLHEELERFTRVKEDSGDSAAFFLDSFVGKLGALGEVHVASCYPTAQLHGYADSSRAVQELAARSGGRTHFVGHHRAHAANAFFSSTAGDALVVTLDGGGHEADGAFLDVGTAMAAWRGRENEIVSIEVVPPKSVNIGIVWTRVTERVLGLSAGPPVGHQAGTVMAMAALGETTRFAERMQRAMTTDLAAAIGVTVDGAAYWEDLRRHATVQEQTRFDIAAGLQTATERLVRERIGRWLEESGARNLCLSGGVALNSVLVGKLTDWFPGLNSVYVPPTPHDGGLSIGAAQHVWHEVLGVPRRTNAGILTPYLGRTYERKDVAAASTQFGERLVEHHETDRSVLEALANQEIVAVFRGGSESGRRALGNRSILADPRNPGMKNHINTRVKHRAWFRPFAPSVTEEMASVWFDLPHASPYMAMAVKGTARALREVPAVLHVDGTARVQTVSRSFNPWFHSFLEDWENISGVPILLNTSLNDREPICETPADALSCLARTEIDLLYFPEYQLSYRRREHSSHDEANTTQAPVVK